MNNLLFFTNFQEYSTKHPISSGCPEIYINILGNITPVNIIDIPTNTNIKIMEQIISMADLLIVHSWSNKEETEKIIQNYKKRLGVKNHICIFRDRGGRDECIRKVKGINL